MNRYVCVVLGCALLWLSQATSALAWGAVAHAVIGQLAEDDLLKSDVQLLTLLRRFRDPTQYHQVREALLGTEPPEPGQALRALANWPDWHKHQPGMLSADDQRHYINLPLTARYNRTQYCADGVCSIETLLEQRAILANRWAPLPQRAVALAWVAHLVGDMHQPLHAGKAEDRGGNLACVAWMGEPSRLVSMDGKASCTGANLHAVWDSQLIEAAAGFVHPDDAPAFAQQLRPLWQRVQAAEPPMTAHTPAEWRAVVERWHNETQALILREGLYPPDGNTGPTYLQRHYPTARLQVLRAAVRLAALLRQSLQP
jgi:nuclease S1